MERPGGKKKITTSSDTEPCLFGWQAIPDGIREVTITEGEIDAMTAWQYGRPALARSPLMVSTPASRPSSRSDAS